MICYVLGIRSIIKYRMFDIFQQRRIFLNSKKKHVPKGVLPELKNSPVLSKRLNDDILATNNTKLVYSYQPLSNILVSKKISPPNPGQFTILTSKKKPVPAPSLHNFKIRRGSAKRNTERGEHDDSPSRERGNSSSMSSRKGEDDARATRQRKGGVASRQQLTFAVVRGNNNEQLVREVMSGRKGWRQVGSGEVPNFKWVFSGERQNYKKLSSFNKKRIINHFECNDEITTKDNLIRNLTLYCQTKKIEVFNVTPLTFVIDFDEEYCQYHLRQFLAFFYKHDPRITAKKNPNFGLISKMQPYMAWQNSQVKKKVNALSKPLNHPSYFAPNSYLWFLKPTGLNRGRGIEIFDSIEQLETILLEMLKQMNRNKFRQKPQKPERKQRLFERSEARREGDSPFEKNTLSPKKKPSSALKRHEQLEKQSESPPKQEEPNQMKPELGQKQQELTGAGSAPGNSGERGYVSEGFRLKTCSFVIQKYVERPMLVSGRKFDIRVWVLLTGSLNIYFFRQGYIRTSTEEFNTQDRSNYFIHLTNNAVQKNNDKYGQFQDGNQLPFSALESSLGKQEVNRLWSRIKQVSFMTFSSIRKKIDPNQRKHCFELFGLDFIIDADHKVWLIQVNQNPCIQCSSPLLAQLIPRMLDDAFKLTVDQVMGSRGEGKSYPVDGYSNGENLWQKLGQLTPNGQYSPDKPQ